MYHILPAEGQAQFTAIKAVYNGRMNAARQSRGEKFFSSVRSAVGSLDKHVWRGLSFETLENCVESQDQCPGSTSQSQEIQHSANELRLDPLGQVARNFEGGLGCPRKLVLGDRNFKHLLPGRDPQATAREPGSKVGNDLAIRIGNEPYELAFGQDFSRDNATPFTTGRILFTSRRARCCRHASPYSCSSDSSATGSGSSSIQPAFTRAFMTIAFASSDERLNRSRAPGTRTRSLSLPSS